MTNLKLPTGSTSWIDYAIATMDARTLHLESCDTDNVIGPDTFRAEARAELDRLQTLADLVPGLVEVLEMVIKGTLLPPNEWGRAVNNAHDKINEARRVMEEVE